MKILINEEQYSLLLLNEASGSQTKTVVINDPYVKGRSFQVTGPYELINNKPVELSYNRKYKPNEAFEIVYLVVNLSNSPLTIKSSQLPNGVLENNSVEEQIQFTTEQIKQNYQGIISIKLKIGDRATGDYKQVKLRNTFGALYPSDPNQKPGSPVQRSGSPVQNGIIPGNSYFDISKNTWVYYNKEFYTNLDFSFFAPGTYTFFNSMSNETKHNLALIFSIATAFIPYVGPWISAGIQVYDANLYRKEGDNQSAGLCLFFALIPFAGPVLNKIPGLKKWSSQALIKIAEKLVGKTPLTAAEAEVVEAITKNHEFVKNATIAEMNANKQVATKAINEVAKWSTKTSIVKGMTNFGATAAMYGAAAYTYNKTYQYVKGDDPMVISKKLGMDWKVLREIFGSDNSKKENDMFVAAIKEGWRPGMVVPEKYRTQTWQKKYGDEF